MELLAEDFPVGEYKTRSGGGGMQLTYISIDATLNRLNEVLGPNWSTRAHTDLRETTDRDGRTTYMAVCELHLEATIDGVVKTAYGVGAMVNPDVDMAAKSALAEATRKAGNVLGIGLSLWNKDKRESIERKMTLANASKANSRPRSISWPATAQAKPSPPWRKWPSASDAPPRK